VAEAGYPRWAFRKNRKAARRRLVAYIRFFNREVNGKVPAIIRLERGIPGFSRLVGEKRKKPIPVSPRTLVTESSDTVINEATKN
jgi:hypothetical protein